MEGFARCRVLLAKGAVRVLPPCVKRGKCVICAQILLLFAINYLNFIANMIQFCDFSIDVSAKERIEWIHPKILDRDFSPLFPYLLEEI